MTNREGVCHGVKGCFNGVKELVVEMVCVNEGMGISNREGTCH